jgi:hypothetical protein
LSTAEARLDAKIQESSENIQSKYNQTIEIKANAILDQLEEKITEMLESIEAINKTSARIGLYSDMLEEIDLERSPAKKLAKEFKGVISKFNLDPGSSFRSLLNFILQLKNSPYRNSSIITELQSKLPHICIYRSNIAGWSRNAYFLPLKTVCSILQSMTSDWGSVLMVQNHLQEQNGQSKWVKTMELFI